VPPSSLSAVLGGSSLGDALGDVLGAEDSRGEDDGDDDTESVDVGLGDPDGASLVSGLSGLPGVVGDGLELCPDEDGLGLADEVVVGLGVSTVGPVSAAGGRTIR
jgi:hypothetical protein